MFCPAGTVSVGSPEKELVSFNRINEISPKEPDKAYVYPISPVDDSGGPPRKLGMGPEDRGDQEREKREDAQGVLAMDGEEEEKDVEQGRLPRSRRSPQEMSPEEYRVHSLTHIPYHPGCKCCVAGRKRDHVHHRFKS